jgi:hypothetical protein
MDPPDVFVQSNWKTTRLNHKYLRSRYPDAVSRVAVVCDQYFDRLA